MPALSNHIRVRTDQAPENWVNVPTNSILTIHNQTVMVHPIMDQYYDRNPYHRRSTAFVRNKGLSANEKGASRSGTPLSLASSSIPSSLPPFPDHLEPQKPRFRGPTIHPLLAGIARSAHTSDGYSSTSSLPRSRTPLSHAEPAPSSSEQQAAPLPSDIRELTAPPVIRSAGPQQAPAQGNIKKKRALPSSAIEAVAQHDGGGFGAGDALLASYLDSSPVAPEPVLRTEFGNPNKIARMFPELALQ